MGEVEQDTRAAEDRAVPYVVLGDPDGVEVLLVPRDPSRAMAFRNESRGRTLCPRALGGCGEHLDIVVPRERIVPYARHRSEEGCTLPGRGGGSMAVHVAMQEALLEWLRVQGLPAWLEVGLTPDDEGARAGRADVVAYVRGVGLVDIEVQRSRDGVGQSVAERTERYLGSTSRAPGHEGERVVAVGWLHDHDPRYPSLVLQDGEVLVRPAEAWGLPEDQPLVPLSRCVLGVGRADLDAGGALPYPVVSEDLRQALVALGGSKHRSAQERLATLRKERQALSAQMAKNAREMGQARAQERDASRTTDLLVEVGERLAEWHPRWEGQEQVQWAEGTIRDSFASRVEDLFGGLAMTEPQRRVLVNLLVVVSMGAGPVPQSTEGRWAAGVLRDQGWAEWETRKTRDGGWVEKVVGTERARNLARAFDGAPLLPET